MINLKKIIILLVFFLCINAPSYAVIKVGTVIFDPPYIISLDQGFEIQLIKSICHQMYEECSITTMKYSKLFSALDAGIIDVAMDNIDYYVSQSPLNSGYIYSFPYLLSEGQFMVLQKSGVKSEKDLPTGSRVGLVREREVVGQGIFYNFFLNKFGSQFKVVAFDDLSSLITALGSGAIDAAFLDKGEVSYWLLEGDNQFQALGTPMKVADGIGLMALQINAPLIARINLAIVQLEQKGEYAKLYSTYFGMGNW